MHEFSITESLLDLALTKAREAGAARVTRVNLVLGEMSGVVGECVQMYFDALRRDTIAAGAELAFETRPAKLRCHRCRSEFAPRNYDWNCPSCHEMAFEITSGRECYLESIEVE
jgi:hydrogenase nickel incorporation protein HypA/HybF